MLYVCVFFVRYNNRFTGPRFSVFGRDVALRRVIWPNTEYLAVLKAEAELRIFLKYKYYLKKYKFKENLKDTSQVQTNWMCSGYLHVLVFSIWPNFEY